jgi:hypothetical protein
MNMKRMRSRGRSHGGGGQYRQSGGGGGQMPTNRNHVFDSSGPDVRVRGTAQQLFERYLQLGRDATGAGDRVQAEAYFQHAEHYFRILNAMNQAAQQHQTQQHHQQRGWRGEYQQPEPDGEANGYANGGAEEEEPEAEEQGPVEARGQA